MKGFAPFMTFPAVAVDSASVILPLIAMLPPPGGLK
jgi:hypothetical protein